MYVVAGVALDGPSSEQQATPRTGKRRLACRPGAANADGCRISSSRGAARARARDGCFCVRFVFSPGEVTIKLQGRLGRGETYPRRVRQPERAGRVPTTSRGIR
jgi:hypothetical protein